jgi:hypothetical protein
MLRMCRAKGSSVRTEISASAIRGASGRSKSRYYGATATEPTDYEANSTTCAMVIPRLLLPLISY